MIEPSRRRFITGLISLVAAPAIVRAGSLMPIKVDVDWRAIMRAGMATDFPTDNLLVRAYERYATSYTIFGFDAFGNKVSEVINVGSVGKANFKSITGIFSQA